MTVARRRRPTRYSAVALALHGAQRHRHWPRALPDDDPRATYDAVIVGAGGHGLATAYHLARDHDVGRIAVLDRGYLGGGNVTRNTAIVRSNYFLPSRRAITQLALDEWERLSAELNFNVMFSQHGILNLAHSTSQLDDFARRANAMAIDGVESQLLTVEEIARRVPRLDLSRDARFPIHGGLLQPRAGTIRHDAVAWGYARAAAALGVDVIQHCDVRAIQTVGGRVVGLDTSRGAIATERLALAASGGTSRLAAMVDLQLPLENHLLQAAVTEPVAPTLDLIVTHGLVNFYVSQTDKGELLMGGNIDGFNSYSTRGVLPPIEEVARACLSLFPSLGRVRLLRTWGGVVDMSMDGSPIVSATPVEGLYINAGWCYGGFKPTPAVGIVFAEMLATGRTPALVEPFSLDRFRTGRIVPEEGHGPEPWRYH
ncbi:MAG: sarcosine oxidase subunit beta family protein [Acidimicrobiales bacterium]